MRGEVLGVWSETWREIWLPMIEEPLEFDEFVHEDIFCDLYRELAKALTSQLSIEDIAAVIDDPAQSREAFQSTISDNLSSERAVVAFMEAAYDAFEEHGGDSLSNRYFNLLTDFIDKYSLRYDLRRPCILCPTLPGMFANLVRDLRALTSQDPHLNMLIGDFENAVRDLRQDSSDGRIKTCIQKQVNLVEAIGRAGPDISRNTLGAICDQLDTWPHERLRDAMKDIYGFTCDYPGIRHGGTPENALRVIDMRDLVAISILLMGFTPYLEVRLDTSAIYGADVAHHMLIPSIVKPMTIAGIREDRGLRKWLEKLAMASVRLLGRER